MDLLTHPIFITIVIAGVGAQVIKFILYSIKFRTLHPLDLVSTGGMPSSHSALTVALSTIIYLLEGPSTGFFLALSLTGVVLVDAIGVRRTAGEEGLVIQQLIKKTKLKIKSPHFALGHTPLQVLVGGVYGFVVALLVGLL